MTFLVVREVQLYHEDEAGEGRFVQRGETAVMKVNFLQVDHGVLQEDLWLEGAQVVVAQHQGLDLVRLGEGGEGSEPGALQC